MSDITDPLHDPADHAVEAPHPVTVQWQDLDGDGHVDLELIDTSGDGRADVQFDHIDETGIAHHALIDTNTDGLADATWSLAGPFPVDGSSELHDTTVSAQAAEPATTDNTAVSGAAIDQPTAVGPFPTTSTSEAATTPAIDTSVSAGTTGFLSQLNNLMGAAETEYRAALDPSSVSQAQMADAAETTARASATSGLLQADTVQTQASNAAYEHDQQQADLTQAHDDATSTWIDAQRSIDAAQDALGS